MSASSDMTAYMADYRSRVRTGAHRPVPRGQRVAARAARERRQRAVRTVDWHEPVMAGHCPFCGLETSLECCVMCSHEIAQGRM